MPIFKGWSELNVYFYFVQCLWNEQNVSLLISRLLNTWCYKLQLHCELLLVNQRTRKMQNVQIDDSTYFFYKYLLS